MPVARSVTAASGSWCRRSRIAAASGYPDLAPPLAPAAAAYARAPAMTTTPAAAETTKNHASLIWAVADLLRGNYRQSDYGKVILPLTVLRRLDCVLEPTKVAVLARHASLEGKGANLDPILRSAAGAAFFNTSKHSFKTLRDAPEDLAASARHLACRERPAAGGPGRLGVDGRRPAGHPALRNRSGRPHGRRGPPARTLSAERLRSLPMRTFDIPE